jgi:hypothetical protein
MGLLMIYTYGISQQGSDHIKRNVECQDAYNIIEVSDDFCIAAVADGLGSELYSGAASKIAAKMSTDFCAKHIKPGMKNEEIKNIIRSSFMEAQKAIVEKAESLQHEITQYDTTLSLSVLIKDTLYFGHVGDSGIVALTSEGIYEKVTEKQNDEYACVFPLCCEDKWIFGAHPNKVASVLLATDGMYDTFFPLYIRNEKINIHVSLISYFMDNAQLQIDKNGQKAVLQNRDIFVQRITPEQVSDDKTIVCVINTDVKPKRQPNEYYTEPDWGALRIKWEAEWKKNAYPNLKELEKENAKI